MVSMDQKLARIAAGLALSNLGLVGVHITEDQILATHFPWSVDEYSEVCSLGGHLIESDDMEETFRDEAIMWRASIKNKKFLALYAKSRPWVQKILDLDN